MHPLEEAFEERLQEIEAYLDLLDTLEQQLQAGIPRFGGAGPAITPQQQKVLYSAVYLQLYSLVEATITRCVDAVRSAAAEGGRWRPGDLSEELRREWVRYMARTHFDLNYENRLASALNLCGRLLLAEPVAEFVIEKGGGGNWDDIQIEEFAARLGCDLRISVQVRTAVKRHIRDDKGALALIKALRNQLAHGETSFTQCGEDETVGGLRDLKERTVAYLREVVARFRVYIDAYEFLTPTSRPPPPPP